MHGPSAADTAVGRRPWSATSLFPRRWLNADDKAELERLAAVEALAEMGIVAPDDKFTQVEEALPLELSKESSKAEEEQMK